MDGYCNKCADEVQIDSSRGDRYCCRRCNSEEGVYPLPEEPEEELETSLDDGDEGGGD